ncbi:Glucose-6-phosphate isomerase [plant metagenome]|uniref:glucose-6-phosphate isomerase n=1 Tax=plant metagenome TaxID=1297885 RepID=A0A484SHX0_9ZZZZ
MSNLAHSPAWIRFSAECKLADRDAQHLRILDAAGLRVDLSAQAWSPRFEQAGLTLLAQQGFEAARHDLFEGGLCNWTEGRAAWHTALRAPEPPAAVAAEVREGRARLRRFVEGVNARNAYRNVVHLGIGGSDWGPRLAVESLAGHDTRRTVRFASNIDAHAIDDALAGLDAQDTLVIIASKSFTTTEPLANAARVVEWMRQWGVSDPYRHIVAVTANTAAAEAFGISPDRIFSLWDWVGGRYSVWSAIGITIALVLGLDAFDAILAGAAAMDQHFLEAPLTANAPVQMALAAVANRSVLGFASQAIAPYDARLRHFVPWLQQLEMESLGKNAVRSGSPASVPTGATVWGMPGTDGQHTFFQWLHQDATGAPVDFLLCKQPDHNLTHHHRLLLANCLAQRSALLRGKSYELALEEAQGAGGDPEQVAWLARHRVHPGRRPSTLIVLPRLAPYSLGALLALYEHKVFTQGVLWDINPFDQWGVEFGKQLANKLAHDLTEPGPSGVSDLDPSTAYWVEALSPSVKSR